MMARRSVAEALQEALSKDRSRQHQEVFYGPGGIGESLGSAFRPPAVLTAPGPMSRASVEALQRQWSATRPTTPRVP